MRTLGGSTRTLGDSTQFLVFYEVLGSKARSPAQVEAKSTAKHEEMRKMTPKKVLRMGLPILENPSGLQECMFSLFRSPQLNLREEKSKTRCFILISPISPYFPLNSQ